MTDSAVDLANQLNRECDCVGTDVAALQVSLGDTLAECGLGQPIAESHPHLFSEAPVFIAAAHMLLMQGVIDAVDAVTRLDAYRESVLRSAPEIARAAPANSGVLLGFDFHISADGPKLIEINTNAGGALLNLEAMRERRECCRIVVDSSEVPSPADQLEEELFAMFLREWRLARGDEPLRRIAIVDADPDQQYLYPEFLLFQRLFESHGVDTVVADPKELSFASGVLTHRGSKIDLVYNRLTDFYFADPAHRALAEAYVSNAAVITPHPRAHALYSNKRNLALLSDDAALRSMGVAEADIATLLRGIPRTVEIQGAEEQWWSDRKRWFFKPAMGFGSRGSYRGDKLTRRVFAEIMEGGYVAQRLEPPSERWRNTAGGKTSFKIDVRNYVYAGKIQLTAARLYQGQTTNFRTAGGGFASVFPAPFGDC